MIRNTHKTQPSSDMECRKALRAKNDPHVTEIQ